MPRDSANPTVSRSASGVSAGMWALTGRGSSQRLPELAQLESLCLRYPERLQVCSLTSIADGDDCWPWPRLELGDGAPVRPTLLFVGGVHGLERIGTQLLLSYLASLLERSGWDRHLRQLLEAVRVVFLPLVNPAGMARGWRSNGQGVDLMRNAPLDAETRATPWLGGQRLSPRLLWYRGQADAPMEAEAQTLVAEVRAIQSRSPFTLVLDCHSGFGVRDHLWFPFAGRARPPARLSEFAALAQLFDRGYPHHPYVVEPQHRNYMTHGDLWDYLYLENEAHQGPPLLPFTLEMGSWSWVKKNPRQLFSVPGLFNPVVEHRLKRTLRRHLLLLDFLLAAAASWQEWQPQGEQRQQLERAALERWYR
ncbi:M14 family zinc carboxypeptidase [Motiliproteus sediminis]|uniref:M14 family zinc carboxypeptidase n=1 Tax=Motiliproteus sediminis TaxID=1468178 RepID=UPI001FECAA66|nr:M14 family zinc carboxypeptidase [Motiliproteus sediminis]